MKLKQHPSLVPYEQLPENEKEYDRKTALETVKTLISLGYKKDKAARESLVASDDLKQRANDVISKLKNPKLTIAELRRIWEERLQLVWFQNEQVYRRAVDNALKLGEAFVAFDIAEEGLQAFPGDLRLIQLQALALARTGATRRANAILEQLRLSGHKDEETLGILARTHKDFWQLAADPDEKRKHLKTSYELYLEGYNRNKGYYTGINAASMGLIYGEREAAQGIARDVVSMCLSKLAALGPESDAGGSVPDPGRCAEVGGVLQAREHRRGELGGAQPDAFAGAVAVRVYRGGCTPDGSLLLVAAHRGVLGAYVRPAGAQESAFPARDRAAGAGGHREAAGAGEGAGGLLLLGVRW
jgi:hypothetical protein